MKQIVIWIKQALSDLIADVECDNWQPRSMIEYLNINLNLNVKNPTNANTVHGTRIDLYQPFEQNKTILSVLPYQNRAVKDLIFGLKFSNDKAAVRICTNILLLAIQTILQSESSNTVLIVPATASPKRRREKGFDQCLSIASLMKKLDPCIVFDKKIIVANILHRRSRFWNMRQLTLARQKRFENVSGRFVVDKKFLTEISNKISHIIIFDDVVTTGATLSEAVNTFDQEINTGLTDKHVSVIGLALAH